MSDDKNRTVSFGLFGLLFWFFVVVKVAGTSFASWSWWWLLLPLVPAIGLWVQKWGL